MKNMRVARRYADALVDLAEKRKNIAETTKDMEYLRALAKESREFVLFLKSPVINRQKKQQVLRVLLADKVQQSTMESVAVIALKGREDLIPDMVDQYFKVLDEREGIINVDVRSVITFSKEQGAVLRDRLQRTVKGTVRLAFGLDEHLIGGFVARVGDTVYDGSVRRQLELLRQRFAADDGRP
jgi:F-type H+-transporting ATPase subunit delta